MSHHPRNVRFDEPDQLRCASRGHLHAAGRRRPGVFEKIYTQALRFLDVGTAYTISSLNLISVTLMSRCLLREKITRMRWIGVCLIVIGVSLVAARTHESAAL